MSSLHTDRAFHVARRNGAYASRTRETWNELMGMSKRELAEIAIRLAALSAGNCDDAKTGFDRLLEERDALRANGII